MSSAYTPPDPAELALLLEGDNFPHPTQQPIFAAYAAGEVGIETLVFRLLQEVKERAPKEAAQRALDTANRIEQARIEAEMAANETADSPTFIPVVVKGAPLTSTASSLLSSDTDASSAPDAEELGEAAAPATEESSGFDDTDEWGPGTSTGEDEDDSDLRGDD